MTETLRGEPAPTLFSLLDECATGMGSRLLRHWLHHPLRDREALEARHDAVACLRGASGSVHKVLRGFCRCRAHHRARRAAQRAAARAGGAARQRSLCCRPCSARLPQRQRASGGRCARILRFRWSACELLRKPCIPSRRRACIDGGVIADGYDAELDELRAMQTNAGEFLVDLEARERERTGIPNLRVEYNRVHGYYIEVTNSHAAKVPDDYRRRQTLKNAERYITPELKAFEDKALSARDRALALREVAVRRAARRAQRRT